MDHPRQTEIDNIETALWKIIDPYTKNRTLTVWDVVLVLSKMIAFLAEPREN